MTFVCDWCFREYSLDQEAVEGEDICKGCWPDVRRGDTGAMPDGPSLGELAGFNQDA